LRWNTANHRYGQERRDTAEPLVGEVRLVRSFRLSDDGALLPLAAPGAPWTDAVNEARCALGRDHDVPAPGCSCGYYAFHDPAFLDGDAAVHAVVACWGRLSVGSHGVRAQYARIEAAALAPDVPDEAQAAMRARYPSVDRYADLEQLLERVPPTRLPGVRLRASWRRAPQRLIATLRWLTTLGVLALPPLTWAGDPVRHQVGALRVALWAGAALVLAAAAVVRRSARDSWLRVCGIRASVLAALVGWPFLLGDFGVLRLLPWLVGLLWALRRARRRTRPATRLVMQAAAAAVLREHWAERWECERRWVRRHHTATMWRDPTSRRRLLYLVYTDDDLHSRSSIAMSWIVGPVILRTAWVLIRLKPVVVIEQSASNGGNDLLEATGRGRAGYTGPVLLDRDEVLDSIGLTLPGGGHEPDRIGSAGVQV
jgi:hypothetical protein